MEVEGRRLRRVLRITPYLWAIQPNGFLDTAAHGQVAMERYGLYLQEAERRAARTRIRQLELDASHFWVLGAARIADLARALCGSPDAVRAVLGGRRERSAAPRDRLR